MDHNVFWLGCWVRYFHLLMVLCGQNLGRSGPKPVAVIPFFKIFTGRKNGGRLLSFLYIWQTIIQAPLVVASGAIGFSQYLTFLIPLTTIEQKLVSGALVVLITFLLYRKITDIGKISVFMGMIVGGTILWLILSAVPNFNSALAFTYSKDAFDLTPVFFLV
jgi:fructoselysine transporter